MTSPTQQKREDRTQWRRNKILELSSQGHTQREIAHTLQVSNGTVNSDLAFLRKQAKENIRSYIDEKIPWEYEKAMAALESINKRVWEISEKSEDRREKLQALSLAKECVTTKLGLLSDSSIINQAISFIEKAKSKVEILHSDDNTNKETQTQESKPETTSNNRTF